MNFCSRGVPLGHWIGSTTLETLEKIRDYSLGSAVASTLTVLIVIITPDEVEAGSVSFPADPAEPELDGTSLDGALEPESEADPETVRLPVGTADGSVLESTMTLSPGPVDASLLTVMDGVSLGPVGGSVGVGSVGGSMLGVAEGTSGVGVGAGVGSTGGSTAGSVTDGTGCVETSCAKTEDTSKMVNRYKDLMMAMRWIRVEDQRDLSDAAYI